jgi:ATP-dependent exoDNAse (exonuclease V) beta subunit
MMYLLETNLQTFHQLHIQTTHNFCYKMMRTLLIMTICNYKLNIKKYLNLITFLWETGALKIC